MGRAPCCDKANVKKGPWSPEEDAKLKSYIEKHGTGGNWIALPQKIGLKRCGKSCRLRWLNYLRPNLKHGGFSEEEDRIICSLYVSIGSRWSVIAAQLPGRTDNDIKNYWNTKLKKKLLGNKHQHSSRNNNTTNTSVNDVTNKQVEENVRVDYSLSSLLPENATQQHYSGWPHVPVLPLQQFGTCFNDQDSIKKLLVKLGGRFSGGRDPVFPTVDGLDLSGAPNSGQDQEIGHVGREGVKFAQGQGSHFMQMENSSNNYNYPQWLDGLEFFFEEDDGKIIGSSSSFYSQSDNYLGETSTPIYHQG